MIDWKAPMEQTFEYYTVNPDTWKDDKLLQFVKSSSITRDSEVDTLGSATFDMGENVGECYVRAYLIAIQNGLKEKVPLGTFLVQTPKSSFDGKMTNVTIDAYTPLIELKENPPELGYSLLEGENIMDNAYLIVRDNARAPVVKAVSNETLFSDFVSNTDDSWLVFVKDLIANAKYEFMLDELGRILFSPKQNMASLQPVITFDDDNSSILNHEISIDQDIYGIPNVVEVIYSNGRDYYHARVVNDDPNSPLSTVNRGRTIIKRVTNPDSLGDPTQNQITEFAEELLKELSTVEYTVNYTHGFHPDVRPGVCVRLNYKRAGLNNIKAKVVSQSIKCETGCQVSEKAVFTNKLWR